VTEPTPKGSRNASVTFEWAGEERCFRLPIGMLRELQEKTGAGPFELMRRIQFDQWRVDDLRETIRCGLIGGGMTPNEAGRLVKTYVDDRPLAEARNPAIVILGAAIYGVDDEPLGKRRPARKTARAAPAPASSASPASMAPEA